MLVLLLLLPFLLQLLGAKDVPKDTKHVIKKITTCPDVGYFFRRDSNPNSLDRGPCYLCFCQDDGTAICWQRENKKCDGTSFKHIIGKRHARVRRSPFSLSDIFFKDAANDVSNSVHVQECKPFESSFGDDCPPADWCIGCTVCDCDTTGHWNCHVLSFCPDKNDKNKMKPSKKPLKNSKKAKPKTNPPKPRSNPPKLRSNPPKPKRSPPKPTRSYQAKPTKTTTKKPTTRRPVKTTRKPAKRINRQAPHKNTTPRYSKNKNIQKHNKPGPKPLIIKKGTPKKNHAPKKTNTKNHNLNPQDTDMLTREVLKNVMAVMQRMLTNTREINDKLLKVLPPPRLVRANNMGRADSQKQFKSNYRTTTKKIPHNKTVPKKNNGHWMRGTRRYKREISNKLTGTTEAIKIDKQVTTAVPPTKAEPRNVTAKDNYYKYVVVTGKFVNTTSTEKPTKATDKRLINTDKYNTSFENGVQQFVMKDKEYLVTTDDLEQKPMTNASNENKVIDDKSILNETFSKTNDIETDSEKIIETNIEKCVKAQSVNVISATQNSKTVLNNSVSFDNATTTLTNTIYPKDIITNASYSINYPTKLVDLPISKSVNLNNFTRSVPRKRVKSIKSRVLKKIADIQNMFKKLLNDFRSRKNNTNTTTEKPKRKRVNIMKYLKKFFKKVFRRKTDKKRMTHNSTVEKNKLRNHVVEAVCEIFENCIINKKNKKILETKINELYIESNNIFRSIKIIKGLLHLLDIRDTNSTSGKFKDDITKLNYILKNDFEQSGQVQTENQLTQIKYIKNNTQIFIQSVGKFANILNYIIATLTSDVNKKGDLRNRRNAKSEISPDNYKRNAAIINDFLKLKNILKKYNLVQNTFMRKMYETVNKFGSTQDNNKMPQVSHQNVRDVNTSLAIEKFSRNIIDNLRKLRNLAVMMNSSNRRKRDAVGDGSTVEYLLTLMEYLLKQNYPFDVTPAKDGIDVLIDAIKSAPDVKPVEHVENTVANQNYEVVTPIADSAPNDSSSGDISDDNKVSKEDNVTNVPESVDVENTEQIVVDKGNEYIEYHKVKTNIFDDNTETAPQFSSSTTTDSEGTVETTTPYHQYKKGDDAHNEFDNLNKYESVPSGRKKFDIFSAEMEEEEVNTEASSTTVAPETTEASDVYKVLSMTTEPSVATTITKLAKVKEKQDSGESSESNDGEKRVSLDWLDESYNREGKGSAENVTKSTTTSSVMTTTTASSTSTISRRPLFRKEDNAVSSITKEFSEEYDKKDQAKMTSEQLMRQKQMDLLNSLDYGTEKSELEDSVDQKDDKEDTFSYYS